MPRGGPRRCGVVGVFTEVAAHASEEHERDDYDSSLTRNWLNYDTPLSGTGKRGVVGRAGGAP